MTEMLQNGAASSTCTPQPAADAAVISIVRPASGGRFRRVPFVGLGALAVALAGCDSSDASSGPVRRDSAGVEIVRAEANAPRLEVGPATLRIGQLEGEEPYVLGRPVGAVRLGSGALVVLDALAHELRWFDGDGLHVRSRGRAGEGPGEFSGPIALLRTGDSVAVYDGRLRRMTLFDSAGALVRTWTVEGPPSASATEFAWHAPPPFGRLEDGRFVHLTSRLPDRTDRVRRTAVVVATSATGEWLGPLIEFSGGDWLVEEVPGGVRQSTGGPAAGDRKASAATDGKLLYVGNGDTYEISVYAPGGNLRRVLRRSVESPPADDAQLQRLMAPLQQRLGEIPAADRPAAARALATRRAGFEAALARHETLPAYQALEVDAAGRLWAARTGSDAEHDVFAPDGRLLGTLSVQGEPLSFGEDDVIVRQEDELGAPTVLSIPLITAGGEPAK